MRKSIVYDRKSSRKPMSRLSSSWVFCAVILEQSNDRIVNGLVCDQAITVRLSRSISCLELTRWHSNGIVSNDIYLEMEELAMNV